MLTLSVRQPDWQKAIQALAVPIREKIRLVFEAVGAEVIAYLKSNTEQRRPPARVNGVMSGPRQAHPGGWADITTVLVNSYDYKVSPTANGWRLAIINTAEYAIYLELIDGVFVVSGVMGRDGPVVRALVEVCARIAPEFKVDASALQFEGHFREGNA